MSESIKLRTIKPIITENDSGMPSVKKADKRSSATNPIDTKIGQTFAKKSGKLVSINKNDEVKTDNPKLVEYSIDLNKPFTITKEMVEKMKAKGKKGFWESLKDGAKNVIPFLSGAMEIKKSIELIAIAKKQENGEKLSKDEKEKLYTFLLEQVENEHRGSSFMGKVGEMLSHLPAFAGEFWVTGGLYSAGNKLALKASQKVLGHVAKTQLTKTFIKKAAAVATGAAVRSVALSSTYAGMMQRRTQLDTSKMKEEKIGDEVIATGEIGIKSADESVVTSISKGLANGFIESFSEQSGQAVMAGFGKIPLVGKFLVPSVGSQKFLSKIGYHGVLEEYVEERFGGFLRGAIGLDTNKNKGYFENLYDSTVPTWEQSGVELTTSALWGGAMTSANIEYNKLKAKQILTAVAPVVSTENTENTLATTTELTAKSPLQIPEQKLLTYEPPKVATTPQVATTPVARPEETSVGMHITKQCNEKLLSHIKAKKAKYLQRIILPKITKIKHEFELSRKGALTRQIIEEDAGTYQVTTTVRHSPGQNDKFAERSCHMEITKDGETIFETEVRTRFSEGDAHISTNLDVKNNRILSRTLYKNNKEYIIQENIYNSAGNNTNTCWINLENGLIIDIDNTTGIATLRKKMVIHQVPYSNKYYQSFRQSGLKNSMVEDIKQHVGTEYTLSQNPKNGLFGGHYTETYSKLKDGDTINFQIRKPDGTQYSTLGQVKIDEMGNIEIQYKDESSTSHFFKLEKQVDSDSGAEKFIQYLDGEALSIPKTVASQAVYLDMLNKLNNFEISPGYYDISKTREFDVLFYYKTTYEGKAYYWAITLSGKTCFPVATDDLPAIMKNSINPIETP